MHRVGRKARQVAPFSLVVEEEEEDEVVHYIIQVDYLKFGPRTLDYGRNDSNRQTQNERTVYHQKDTPELASLHTSNQRLIK
jgi:hypothetical protein